MPPPIKGIVSASPRFDGRDRRTAPQTAFLVDDRYSVKDVSLLSARASRAFHEMTPIRPSAEEPGRVYRKVPYRPHLDIFFLDMRTYRGPNTWNDQAEPSEVTSFIGRDQIDWLKRALAESRATWKVIASDMPVGMIVRDGEAFENGANGTVRSGAASTTWPRPFASSSTPVSETSSG